MNVINTNYSNEIRKTINNFLNNLEKYLMNNNIDKNMKYEAFVESLKMMSNSTKLSSILKYIGLFNENEQRLFNLLKTMIYFQSYTDFYLLGRFYSKIEKNDSSFSKVDYHMIENDFFETNDLYKVMLISVEEFKYLSAYDKILIYKEISEEENKMLKSINPFYEYEKNIYDIKIDKELILRQMGKWEKSFGLDVSLSETVNFIFKLYKIDKNNIKCLFNEINLNDVDNKININESIIFNNNFITRDILKEQLIEQYNSKEKVKK